MKPYFDGNFVHFMVIKFLESIGKILLRNSLSINGTLTITNKLAK